MLPNPIPNSDESRWIIQIRRALEEDFEAYHDLPVSISDVPKMLLSNKPEAYTPQLVALGPYHHRRQDLYDMERYKLFAAKRAQSQIQNLAFQDIVHLFANHEFSIRAHYHRFMNITGEALAWLMALDASFLLEFLQIFVLDEGSKNLRRIPSRMSHLVANVNWRRSAHDMIIRDLVMLENQIPLFLLRKILEIRCSSSEDADKALSTMLIGFLREISPFKMLESSPSIEVSRHPHLLELLYHEIVPRFGEPTEIEEGGTNEEQSWDDRGCIGRVTYGIKGFIPRIFKCLFKIPWRIITTIPAFAILKEPIEHLFSQMDRSMKPTHETLSPLLEEITIPSVAELILVGIKFAPVSGNLSTIKFDQKTGMLHLPMISLDVNSEVVFRNLVAYEASIVLGPVVLTRYVELMNGIIDTEEDVVLLRERGIVSNHMKSDREVAELWNGMSRSLRLSRVPVIDRVIEDVNKYYNNRWRVKVSRFLRRYVGGSCEPIRFVIVVLVLMVLSLQGFCAIYGCFHWSHVRRIGF